MYVVLDGNYKYTVYYLNYKTNYKKSFPVFGMTQLSIACRSQNVLGCLIVPD
jgi:hypothetical protein